LLEKRSNKKKKKKRRIPTEVLQDYLLFQEDPVQIFANKTRFAPFISGRLAAPSPTPEMKNGVTITLMR
jgi:hypothetical protein